LPNQFIAKPFIGNISSANSRQGKRFPDAHSLRAVFASNDGDKFPNYSAQLNKLVLLRD
jgi:hypothetical protein